MTCDRYKNDLQAAKYDPNNPRSIWRDGEAVGHRERSQKQQHQVKRKLDTIEDVDDDEDAENHTDELKPKRVKESMPDHFPGRLSHIVLSAIEENDLTDKDLYFPKGGIDEATFFDHWRQFGYDSLLENSIEIRKIDFLDFHKNLNKKIVRDQPRGVDIGAGFRQAPCPGDTALA